MFLLREMFRLTREIRSPEIIRYGSDFLKISK